MAETTVWNWDKVGDPFWTEPAEDVYFLLHRWTELGLRSLLDLGCGLGRHALLFARHGFSVTALDRSDSGLRKLRQSARRMNLSVPTVLATVTRLPLPDRSVDAVLAYHSIYHVDSAGMGAAIAEVGRVLRPHGEAYLTLTSKSTPSYTDPACRAIDSHVRMKQEEDGSIVPHYFCDRTDLSRLLAGFRLVKLRHTQDIYDGGPSWHYFVHVSKPCDTT
jgi:SAM-dependent methyltransferase